MITTINNEHKELNFSSEREQSQVCLNSAEHEKNQGRKVLNVPNLRFPEFQGSGKKNDWQTSQICIKELVYPKTNCLMMANLVFYMESFTRSTNRKQ